MVETPMVETASARTATVDVLPPRVPTVELPVPRTVEPSPGTYSLKIKKPRASSQSDVRAESVATPSRGACEGRGMATPARLTDAEITAELRTTEGWALVAGKLHRTFQFADFVTAFSFMTGAALVAERMNHHPEWFNVYRTVRVDLATHDAGGVTALDVALARAMNALAAPLAPAT